MSTASEKVVLEHDIEINGTKYTKGRQDVPTEVADDLRRMNSEHNAYLNGLHRKRVYEHNSGTMSVGGAS